MSRNPDFIQFEQPEVFSHQTLELTFRLLRNNNPLLAHAIKLTLDEIVLAPNESLYAVVDEVHLNVDVLNSLGAAQIITIVAELNNIARSALDNKNLSAQHMRLLRNLIEDWAKLTEWILSHTSIEQIAVH